MYQDEQIHIAPDYPIPGVSGLIRINPKAIIQPPKNQTEKNCNPLNLYGF
jgi:hypothetical protein